MPRRATHCKGEHPPDGTAHPRHTRFHPHSRPPRPSSPPAPPPPTTTSTRPHKRRRHPGPPQANPAESWQPAHLHRFDPDTQEWRPLVPTRTAAPPPRSTTLFDKLTLLTYNTWSSSPSHTPAQSRAVLSLVRDAGADIVLLQEVSPSFFRLLCAEPWLRAEGRWALTTADEFFRAAGTGARKRGKEGEREACVVLVRVGEGRLGRGADVWMTRLERARDEGGKAAIALRLCDDEGDERVRLVTSHFSSLPDNAPLRSRQYAACLSFLSAAIPPPSSSQGATPTRAPLRVLAGDFNASSAAELAPLSHAPHHLVDACPPAAARASSPSTSRPSQSRPWSAHPRTAAAAAAAAAAERDAASFARPPTFGHLYPLVTPHARKPRKPRRIDRVYFCGGGEEEEGRTRGRVRATGYAHLGGERSLEGGQRDRTGRGGRAWASDHEAVRVVLEWGTL